MNSEELKAAAERVANPLVYCFGPADDARLVSISPDDAILVARAYLELLAKQEAAEG